MPMIRIIVLTDEVGNDGARISLNVIMKLAQNTMFIIWQKFIVTKTKKLRFFRTCQKLTKTCSKEMVMSGFLSAGDDILDALLVSGSSGFSGLGSIVDIWVLT